MQLISQLDAELGIEKFRTELESSRVLVSRCPGGHLEEHTVLALHASARTHITLRILALTCIKRWGPESVHWWWFVLEPLTAANQLWVEV